VKPRSHKQDSLIIVYDADCIQQPGRHLFDPEYWKKEGRVTGEAAGRGSALFLDTEFGPTVLRQYLRGGYPARVSRDRYLFTGFDRSRPLKEFRLLSELYTSGLPVPSPVAALCRRKGLFWTGWLMMKRIRNVTPLADLLASRSQDEALWRSVGGCVRRFHDQGVVHADLNARNILVGVASAVYLVDFDRAAIRAGATHAFDANLKRLRRSLEKLWPVTLRGKLDEAWGQLIDGYQKA